MTEPEGEWAMKKRILALLLAGIMVLSAGCSANVSVDPDTGVVAIDGVPVNEIMKDLNADSVSEDAVFEEEPEDVSDTDEVNEEEYDGVIEYDGGLRIDWPEEFVNTKGIMDAYSVGWDEYKGIYLTEFFYTGVSGEWVEEALDIPDPKPEDQEKYRKATAMFTHIFSIGDNKGVDELAEFINENTEDEELVAEEKYFEELAKVDDLTFYRYTGYDKMDAENLEGDFAKEFDALYDELDEVLKNAEYYKPEVPYSDILGKKVEFTTTDIDGNKIKSEDIFSQHEVTMVNVWATWCPNCIEELPELNEIDKRLAKKDCAVVGIVGDGNDEELIEEARQILKESNDEFLNILPWDGAFTDDFPMDVGWPTTFFVDREGTMVAKPAIGKRVKDYEKIIDSVLEGREPETKNDDESGITANEVNQYRIYVSDTDGNLIEGAMVQLCDDSTCRVENTDKNGLAVFKVKEAGYTVHILKQPKGYKTETKEYKMPAEYSDLHIILEKE